jgi:DNA repair photolyase
MHKKTYKHILLANHTMNLTRGCTHGCIYCDSRSECYQMKHDFEDVEIKANAAGILDGELLKKRKKFMIKTGAMSDPYMNVKEVLAQTRACFEVVHKHRFGLSFQTKSISFLKDMDLLEKIHKDGRLVVQMTLTTCDDLLSNILEPGVDVTSKRVEALKVLKDKGIPSVVWLSPLLPFINDDLGNLKCLLDYCYEAGVKGIIWYGPGLTLRDGNREYFYKKLDQYFPGLKEKYQKKYGLSYQVQSDNQHILNEYFIAFCENHHILYKHEDVFAFINDFPKVKHEQLSLF